MLLEKFFVNHNFRQALTYVWACPIFVLGANSGTSWLGMPCARGG